MVVIGIGFLMYYLMYNGGWVPQATYSEYNAAIAVTSDDEKGLVVGTRNGRLLLVEILDRRVRVSLDIGSSPVCQLGLSQSESLGFASTIKGPVVVFKYKTGEKICSISPEQGTDILSVCLSPRGDLVAVCFGNGLLLLRSLESDRESKLSVGKMEYMCFSDSGRKLWLAGKSGAISAVDVVDQKISATVEATHLPLAERRTTLVSEGELVVDNIFENYTRVWDRNGMRVVSDSESLWNNPESLYQSRSNFACGTVSRCGKMLVAGNTLWATTGGRKIAIFDATGRGKPCASWFAKRGVLIVYEDGKIILWAGPWP
jgi:hypothetical protein